MWYYIIKVLSSSVIIVLITEISKKSSFWGSVLASIPLVSLLAFLWIYIDTKDIKKISELSTGIFWLVIPSLAFFISFPYLLKKSLNFYLALIISLLIMVILYFVMVYVLKKFGIKI
jgi:ABC-type xylose transport system permease subunit